MKKLKIFLIIAFIVFLVITVSVGIYLKNNYQRLMSSQNTIETQDFPQEEVEEKEPYNAKELYYENYYYLRQYYKGSVSNTAILKRIESYVLNFLPYFNVNIKNLSLEELESYVENNSYYLMENAGIAEAQELEDMKENINKITVDIQNDWDGIEIVPETCEKNRDDDEYFTFEFYIRYKNEEQNKKESLKIEMSIINSVNREKPTYKFVIKEYNNETQEK